MDFFISIFNLSCLDRTQHSLHEKHKTLDIARLWHLQLHVNVVESSSGDLEMWESEAQVLQ